MNRWARLRLTAGIALILGGIGCLIGASIDRQVFFSAWLCTSLFWLGLPLGALTLVLVHDLTGGGWMATARPVLNAAIATMPIATIALLPVLADLGHIYRWSAPDHPALGNAFYLNQDFFFLRYAIDFAIWNGFAAFALLAPRAGAVGIARGLSWLSGIGLVLLAYSCAFASIDWIMSLEPQFWSAVFGMIISASWFNTGLALVLFALAWRGPLAPVTAEAHRDHLADLAALLLATTIFWAYTEFCQFLIIWEENLRSEIPWYLHRMAGAWEPLMYAIAALGFFIPFLVLVWRPAKRSSSIVALCGVLILISRALYIWWLILPDLPQRPFSWVDVAAWIALGGLMLLVFLGRLREGRLWPAPGMRHIETSHGRS